MAKLKKAKSKKTERDKSVARERKLVNSPKPMPDWIVTELTGGKLGIACPRTVVTHTGARKKCGGKAVVNKQLWLMIQPDYRTRGCTYCFQTSRIPLEILPKRDTRRLDG